MPGFMRVLLRDGIKYGNDRTPFNCLQLGLAGLRWQARAQGHFNPCDDLSKLMLPLLCPIQISFKLQE